MNLQELGFSPFECDGEELHSKDFPEINYTLCESNNDTFTISTCEDGNIIVRLPIEHLEEVDQMFSIAEMQITNFKNELNTLLQSLIPN